MSAALPRFTKVASRTSCNASETGGLSYETGQSVTVEKRPSMYGLRYGFAANAVTIKSRKSVVSFPRSALRDPSTSNASTPRRHRHRSRYRTDPTSHHISLHIRQLHPPLRSTKRNRPAIRPYSFAFIHFLHVPLEYPEIRVAWYGREKRVYRL